MTRPCAIDRCGDAAAADAPLCAHHWALVPEVIKDTIAEARRLKCPHSAAGYSTVAVAVAKQRSNEVRAGLGPR